MDNAIYKAVALRAEPGTGRTLRFTISTGDQDRMGDTIDPDGWDLADWRANPIILFGHDHGMPAIARGIDIGVVRGALKSTAEFPPEGLHPLADTVYNLAKGGFLGSASVGFIPLKWSFNDRGGRDFSEQRLLEWSIVNCPALPQAQLEPALGARAAIEKWLGRGPAGQLHPRPSRTGRADEVVIDLVDDDVGVDAATVRAALREVMPLMVRAELGQRGLILDDEPDEIGLSREEIADAIRIAIGALVQAALLRARGRID